MKVYLSKPRYHWYSPYTWLEHIFFWKPWSDAFRGDTMFKDTEEYPEWVEKWADRLTPISKAIEWTLNKIHPQVNYVKIDYWDTWSMDCTLSPIILPMLKQLKETKHGSPIVDDEDVPDHLKATSAPAKENEWDTDDNWHLRWEWVMDEMIWAFEQIKDDEAECRNFYKDGVWDMEGRKKHEERIQNGLRLFGKYFRGLWD